MDQPAAVRVGRCDRQGAGPQCLPGFHHPQPGLPLVAAVQEQEFDVADGHAGVPHPGQGFLRHGRAGLEVVGPFGGRHGTDPRADEVKPCLGRDAEQFGRGGVQEGQLGEPQ